MVNVETKDTKIKKSLPKNDITFYRLVVLFVYAIVAIIGINLIRENEVACRKVFSSIYFIIGMAILFVACIFVIIMKYFANKVIRLNSIAKVLAPLFFMMSIYTNINNANYKTEIVIIATIVLAFVLIVYPKNYFSVSLVVAIEYFSIYCITNSSSKLIDQIFYYIAYPASIIAPCLVILVLILGKNKKELKIGKSVIEIGNNKLVNIAALVLMILCIIAALLVIFLPVTFGVVSIALLAVFILIGVICTIKML